MSSISVSKGSSFISSVFCVTVGFPEGRKRVHWIYNIISLIPAEQLSWVDVIRGRPAEFMKSSVLKDQLNFTSGREMIPAKWTSMRMRQNTGRWKLWENTKFCVCMWKVKCMCRGGKRISKGILNHCKHASKYLSCLWVSAFKLSFVSSNSKLEHPQWPPLS